MPQRCTPYWTVSVLPVLNRHRCVFSRGLAAEVCSLRDASEVYPLLDGLSTDCLQSPPLCFFQGFGSRGVLFERCFRGVPLAGHHCQCGPHSGGWLDQNSQRNTVRCVRVCVCLCVCVCVCVCERERERDCAYVFSCT